MTVVELLDQLFQEKQLPVSKNSVENDLVLYVLDYNITPKHALRMEMVVPSGVKRTDVQITYRYVTMLSRYEMRYDMLEVINDINEMQSAYYTFYLAKDGEVYARALVRMGEEIQNIYETLVHGPAVIESVLPQIVQVAGEFTNV